MPVFKRYKIDRYKEVMINQSTGLSQDGGLSTYTFDNEFNRDFVGIVKDIRLIGDVVEITMDTGRFSVNQINNTTQTEFDQLVFNGTIRITERSLGWVEIAKTRASFYYEECSPTSFVRKRPVSEHYYDFSTFVFGTSLVAGSGPQDTDIQHSVGEDALRPIGTFDPNIGNNMGVFGPGFNQLDLQSYMRMVINSTISTGNGFIQNTRGETRPVNSWSPLDGEILRQIPLYLANTNEHFDNPNSQTISSGKYGRNRDTISEGFRASSYVEIDFFKAIGVCKETEIESTNVTNVSDTNTFLVMKLFYVNDSSITTDYGNNKVQAADTNILYRRGLYSNQSNQDSNFLRQRSNVPQTGVGRPNLSDLFDPTQPPINPRPDRPEWDQSYSPQSNSSTNYILDSAARASNMVIFTNYFVRNKTKDALIPQNLGRDLITYTIYPGLSDTSEYDTKLRIARQKTNPSDYVNKLIFIKNELKQNHKKITG